MIDGETGERVPGDPAESAGPVDDSPVGWQGQASVPMVTLADLVGDLTFEDLLTHDESNPAPEMWMGTVLDPVGSSCKESDSPTPVATCPAGEGPCTEPDPSDPRPIDISTPAAPR